jgi:hypothetical protein
MPHQPLTVPGGKRGNLTGTNTTVYSAVREFLTRYDLMPNREFWEKTEMREIS